MGHKFAEIAFTPNVKAMQDEFGSRKSYARMEQGPDTRDVLGPEEVQFLADRDSFYMATVSETGWPYMQHRGGPPGFLHVLDERRIGFADFSGNRQYVSVGNLQTSDRVSLFFMDYARRRRLKMLGHARIIAGLDEDERALLEKLGVGNYRARVERGMIISVAAFDWNCPQHITPRFTADDVAAASQGMLKRIADLEAQVKAPVDLTSR